MANLTQAEAIGPLNPRLGLLVELPASMDGSEGVNRAPSSPVGLCARTDLEAMVAFLAEHRHPPRTFELYRREVLLLHLWAAERQKKSISDLGRLDIQQYIDFLIKPPQSWCAERARRDSNDWRPFTGPQTNRSIEYSLTVIRAYFRWLQRVGHIVASPVDMIKNPKRLIRSMRMRRDPEGKFALPRRKASAPGLDRKQLHPIQIGALYQAVWDMPRENPRQIHAAHRAEWLLNLGLHLAPRVSDIVAGRMGHIQRHHLDPSVWYWPLLGKAREDDDEPDRVPLSAPALKCLQAYRRSLGLPKFPAPGEKTALVPQLHNKEEPIKARRINQILADLGRRGAVVLTAVLGEDHPMATHMEGLSSHWLRHAGLTEALRAGASTDVALQLSRHKSEDTLNKVYRHGEVLRAASALTELDIGPDKFVSELERARVKSRRIE